MKKRRKLTVQLVLLIAVVGLISMTAATLAAYTNSRNAFLSAKNEMLERDLNEIKKTVTTEYSMFPWLYDFAREHKITPLEPLSEEESLLVTDDIQTLIDENNEFDISKLYSKPEDLQMLYARDIYFTMASSLRSNRQFYGYSRLTCLDVSPETCGMVYYDAVDGEPLECGERLDLDPEDHPAVKAIQSGKYDNVEYEIVDKAGGSRYIAYTPLVSNGEIKAVLRLEYDWTDYYNDLTSRIRIIALIVFCVILLVCVVLMLSIKHFAVDPIKAVGSAVREYRETKDSTKAAERLGAVKTKNEIAMLSNDVKEMTTELDSYIGDIKTLSVEVMQALAKTIDAKDKYTNGHSFRVAIYSRMLAKKLGLSAEDQENIYYMGLLHDIGKIGVPNEIINKPSRLTDEEFGVIKTHPVLGYEILSELKSRPDLTVGARWHHERYDGRGYPDGLKGDEIPFLARIIAVADSYDAMTSTRSYRSHLPQDVVRSEIEKNLGTQFDPEVGKAMLEIMDSDTNYMLHE